MLASAAMTGADRFKQSELLVIKKTEQREITCTEGNCGGDGSADLNLGHDFVGEFVDGRVLHNQPLIQKI